MPGKLSQRKRCLAEKAFEQVQELYVALDRRVQEHLARLSRVLNVEAYSFVEKMLALLYLDARIAEVVHDMSRAITVFSELLEELGRDPVPPINWSVLPFTLARQQVLYYRVRVTLNTPENLFAKSVLLYMHALARRLVEELESYADRRPWLALTLDRLRRVVRRAYDLLSFTWLRYIELSPGERLLLLAGDRRVAERYKVGARRRVDKGVAPRTYGRLLELYEEFVRLSEDLKVVTERARSAEERTGYFVNPARLYEVFALLVLLEVLGDVGAFADIYEGVDATYFVYEVGGESVYVAFNQLDDLRNRVSLRQITSLRDSRSLVKHERYLGLPDIILKRGDRMVILECKFKLGASSLTEARYKVLGYMLEYDVDSGVLVFPEVLGMGSDPEAVRSHELFREAQENGVAIFYDDKLSKTIAIVSLSPLRPLPRNKDNLKMALERLGVLA